MQKIIATILLLALVGQTFRQGVYYIDYLFDKAEYVKSCVNKARPAMNCDGKCALMKKIAAAEKEEQQKAPEMKLAGKMEVVSSNDQVVSIEFNSFSATQLHILTNEGSPIDQANPVFHPPAV